MPPISVGVLLNPIAGFGGKLALHGTDLLPAERFDEAVAAGRAERRMLRAIELFLDRGGDARLVAAPGLLGDAQLTAAGVAHETLSDAELGAGLSSGLSAGRATTRDDTRAAARALARAGVDCLLFAGGDGTATDIAGAIGTGLPVVGVPAGVKMHSEVFARAPESAGRLLAEFARGPRRTELVEVLDVGPDDRTGVVAQLRAPLSAEPLQGAKTAAPPRSSAVERRAIARELVAAGGLATTWIVGPGTTAGALAEELGFAPTLRGVDVRHPGGKVELDVDEARLYDIVGAAAQPHLVLGVVGGQGFLLGRGNHEISMRVLERIGVEGVSIVATEDKIGLLIPPVLLVDIDVDADTDADAAPPHPLTGYRRVRTGHRQSTMMRVVDAAAA